MPSKARKIWEAEPELESDDDMVDRAREIVRETGDIPEAIWYEAIMRAVNKAIVSKALLAMRPDDAEPYSGKRI